MSVEELQMADVQMKALTEKISSLLQKLDKSKRPELDIEEIASKLKDFKIAIDKANIEIRHLQNHPDKQQYKTMVRDHKNTYRELNNDYEWKKKADTKNQLLGDAASSSTADQTTNEGAMKYALGVQDESMESLKRTLRTVNDAKVIGEETVRKLQQNTEQIEQMYDKLESIETTLQRSTKIIRRMARKVATDKYIWVIVFLVFAAIVAIIFLQYRDKL